MKRALAFLALSVALTAQQRDPGGAPQSGTGVIAGTLMTDEASPQPVRRATITLSGGGMRGQRQTVTDSMGRFVLQDLPSGTFNMTASKLAYLMSTYGSRGYGQSGMPIVLTAGQRFTAAMKMTRGGVVSGTITDQQGRPQQVRVQLLQYRTAGGQKRLVQGPGATTDDRGVYRIYGLAPGDYLVAATPTNNIDARPVTTEEIQWAQASRGAGPAGAPIPPPAPAGSVGLSPVYYPGAIEVSTATTIKLGLSEERGGIDFQVMAVPVAKISGAILDPEGRPVQGPQINLVSEERLSGQVPSFGSSEVARIDSNGTFTFSGVPPGRYTIVARSTSRPVPINVSFGPAPPAPPVPPAMPGLQATAPAPPPTLWAMAQVDVSGRDLTGITLALQPGLTVAGRLAFEATTLTAPADLTKVRLTMSAIDPGPINMSVPGVTANADGTFLLQGILPGRYRLTATSPSVPGPQGGPWIFKSFVVTGRDVLDTGLEVGTSSISGAVATFTDRATELTGSLLDTAGLPADDLSVILFTTDRSLWTPVSRRIRVIRPNLDGRFRFSPWFPGEYYLGAIINTEQLDYADLTAMEQMAAAAIKITLAEGEKKTQDMRVR